MKKQNIYISFLFIFFFGNIHAQPCNQPTAQYAIHGNNVRANLLNGGDLFWDFSDGQFKVPYVDTNSPSSIFAAGLFMGGLSPGGNLKLSSVTYRNGASDLQYVAGPLDENGTTTLDNCANFDRFWSVKGDEILAHIADFDDNGIIDNPNPNIMGWPGNGNPNFFSIYGFELPSGNQNLAPFFDNITYGTSNTIGVYEPELGDYPILVLSSTVGSDPIMIPAEMSWCVFNDSGNIDNSLRMEIQMTTYALACDGNNVFDNTLFTSYKFINKGQEDILDFYTCMWVDFDLGCYMDDFIGSSPERNSFFVYNEDNIDGPCLNGIPSFGENPPVQAVTFLNSPLTNFMSTDGNIPAGFFNLDNEIYNFMTGKWADGTPLTYGGNGYDPSSTNIVNHAFPDDPTDPLGWSMNSAVLPFSDRRVLGSYELGTLQPGQIFKWDIAWSNHITPDSNYSELISVMYDEIDLIQDLYNQGFDSYCLSTAVDKVDIGNDISIFPNPTSEMLNVDFQDLEIDGFQIIDAMGRVVLENDSKYQNSFSVDVSKLSQGIYFLKGKVEQHFFNKKIIIID